MRRVAALVMPALLVACTGSPLESETFADVLRAVAVQVRDANPGVTVRVVNEAPAWGSDATADTGALPWAARQGLTTAGFELVEPPAAAGAAAGLLRFDSVSVAGKRWAVHADGRSWTVVCDPACGAAIPLEQD